MSLEKRIGELKAKLTFATKEEAQEKIDEFTENAEQMSKDYDSALKALNDSKEKIASIIHCYIHCGEQGDWLIIVSAFAVLL